ncbi:unnamed protein product [Spirodela intermedia]|uniref:Peptidase M16C associated domain-containing protein n=1 Tax=Spirodela intermedia TaxID=51605 RepID=A0ABN7E8T3_SPIIN|nr:unnamed protein product [Spirodela intermedia]
MISTHQLKGSVEISFLFPFHKVCHSSKMFLGLPSLGGAVSYAQNIFSPSVIYNHAWMLTHGPRRIHNFQQQLHHKNMGRRFQGEDAYLHDLILLAKLHICTTSLFDCLGTTLKCSQSELLMTTRRNFCFKVYCSPKFPDDIHHKYYHPSNAKIWFYGDDDPNERLHILSALSTPVRVIVKYLAGDGDDNKKKHMVCLSWVLSAETLDLETESHSAFWITFYWEHQLLHLEGSYLKVDWEMQLLAMEWKMNYFNLIFSQGNNTGSFPRGLSLMLHSIPDPNKESQDKAVERQILEKVKSSMTQEDLVELVCGTRELCLRQETPDPLEALKCIPSLSLDDIPRKPIQILTEIAKVNGVKVLQHDLFTNDVLYLEVVFDLCHLRQDLLQLIPLFCQSLLEMRTRDLDFVRLNQLVGRKTGGISIYPFTPSVREKADPCFHVIVHGKAIGEWVEDLFSLCVMTVSMIFVTVVYLVNTKIGIGTWCHNMRINEWRKFGSGIWVIGNLFPQVVLALIKHGKKTFVRVARGKTTRGADCNWGVTSISYFNVGRRGPDCQIVLMPGNRRITKARKSVPASGSEAQSGSKPRARAQAAWLWDRQARVRHSPSTSPSSRDPNLLKTVDVYDAIANFLYELELDDNTLTKAIIGAIGDVDPYQLPDAKGYSSLMRHLLGITEEERQIRHEEILSTSMKHFREFADAIEVVKDKGVVVAVAPIDDVAKANEEKGGFFEVKKVL